MYLAKDIIRNTFTQIKESSALAVCGIIVVLAVLSCDQTVMSFANLFSLHLRGILFAIFLIILPITALVKIRLKEKGQK